MERRDPHTTRIPPEKSGGPIEAGSKSGNLRMMPARFRLRNQAAPLKHKVLDVAAVVEDGIPPEKSGGPIEARKLKRRRSN